MREGEAVVVMKALTDVDSDAMEMRYPVYVRGLEKLESWSGVIRPNETQQTVTVSVPEARRPESTVLTVQFSPSLATAMVGVHLLIGVGEGVITFLAVGAIVAVRPDLVYGARRVLARRELEIKPRVVA